MVLSGLTYQRVFRRTVYVIFAFCSTGWLHAQSTEIAGTMPEDYLPALKQILATALQRSPNLIGPAFEVELRGAQRIRERSALLPGFGGGFNYGTTEVSESGNNSSRSRDQGLFYNLGINQALFHWGALKNSYAIAKINQSISEKNFAKAYRDLAVLLRESYLGLIVHKAKVRVSGESLRMVQENVEVLQQRLQRGEVASADVSGEELKAREAKLDYDRARTELTNLRRTFIRIAGIGDLPEEAIPDTIPAPMFSPDLATAITATILRDQAKSTIEAQVHELRVQDALRRYKIDSVRLLPKFGLGAGYSIENNTTVNGNSVGQRAVARQTMNVSASWNIFDGFATRAAKMESRALQRLNATRRDAELQELLETVQALERHLKVDAVQLELVEVRRGMAEEIRRRAEEEYGFGKLPKLDIERAKIGIYLAETRTLEARAALLSRWSEFIALATYDPVLNNLPAYARVKK
jgi:outer membrane protein TolC